MEKTSKLYLLLLLAFMACGDDEGGRRTFSFVVFNGEQLVNNQNPPVAGASVKVYSSAQAWFDGDAPLKTFTTNDKGGVETFDKFETGAVAYAESGNWNNWPSFIHEPNLHFDNTGVVLTGSAVIGTTFLSDFESVKNKAYLISDVRVNSSSIFGSVSACSKDNFIKLQSNCKFLFSEGADICTDEAASHEYVIYMYNSMKSSYPLSDGYYQLGTDWADAENKIFIKSDFSQILFKAGETTIFYTLQN